MGTKYRYIQVIAKQTPKTQHPESKFGCYTQPMLSFDTVREMALALPHVEEGTSYGTPALKVKGKLFVRLKEDGETIVLKTTYEEREELMAHDLETYFITDHYLNYPYILVSLKRVHPDGLRELILTSYRLAKPGQTRGGA